MKRPNTFKLPNRLIRDGRLSPSARKVGAALYAHRNALGFCRRSLDSLAGSSGLCPATVRKAVDELAQAGYLSTQRTWRYLRRKRRVVYGPTAYQLSLRFHGGYTLVPRELLGQCGGLTPAAFLTALCLLQFAGNRRRAFPSIAQLHRAAGLARSTVCRALRQLKATAWLLVLLCRKRTGAFAANSYHFAAVVRTDRAANATVPAAGPDAAERGLRNTPDVKTSGVLHTLILKLRAAARKLFSARGVVPFLANKVRT